MEKLSTSLVTAEHKLLILYVLEKADTPVESIRLTDYMLEHRLMNYLSFQQRVHELTVSGHVERAAGDGSDVRFAEYGGDNWASGTEAAGGPGPAAKAAKSAYAITAAGSKMLASMVGLLPETEKNRIDRTVGALRRRLLDERAVTADYEPGGRRHMVARLALTEGAFSAIRLELAVSSAPEARAVCARWKEHAPEIYARICALFTDGEAVAQETGGQDGAQTDRTDG